MSDLFKRCDKGEVECDWKTATNHCLLGTICEVEEEKME